MIHPSSHRLHLYWLQLANEKIQRQKMQISILPIDVIDVVPKFQYSLFCAGWMWVLLGDKEARKGTGPSDLPCIWHQRDSRSSLSQGGRVTTLCVGPGQCPPGFPASSFRNMDTGKFSKINITESGYSSSPTTVLSKVLIVTFAHRNA